jgi:formate dehydrogenase major subunit
MGHDWPTLTPEQAWDELRSLSPMHRGMSYARLEGMGGIQWPCPDEDHAGTPYLHSRLWEEDTGPKAPFSVVEWSPPVDPLDDEYPMRLTTGRRLDSFNTGVQTGRYQSPRRIHGVLDLSPEDAGRIGVGEGDLVEVVSRRGRVTAPVRVDRSLRPGLSFMSVHFPDDVDVNRLTIDAWDPKSGTAEFKATAVRIEPVAG